MNSFFSSWYFVVIVLGTAFIFFTRKSLNEVIRKAAIEINHRLFKFKTTGQEQQKVTKVADESLSEHKEFKKLLVKLNVKNFTEFNKLLEEAVQESLSDKNKINELDNRLNTVISLWRFYMFSYLSVYLVPNSKIALLWLYNNPNSTKDMFKLTVNLPLQILNPDLEREAIFNALVSHFLIVKDDRDLYMVSDLGREFLVFVGLIKST